jgi:formylmethanofuran:tetrahydromethanopterin formyltransferase
MKKLAIILAIMMIPFTAFALDTISDADLNDLTGQAGVSIFLNTIRIEKSTWYSGYGDEGETAFGANTNWLLTRTDGQTREISFLGSRTLDIDIVSRTEFTNAVLLGSIPGVLPGDALRFGSLEMSALNQAHTAVSDAVSDVAVIISLPNGIQIADFGTTKTIMLGQAANTVANPETVVNAVLIKTYTGGGTTTITGAGGAAAANNVHIGIMAHD